MADLKAISEHMKRTYGSPEWLTELSVTSPESIASKYAAILKQLHEEGKDFESIAQFDLMSWMHGFLPFFTEETLGRIRSLVNEQLSDEHLEAMESLYDAIEAS